MTLSTKIDALTFHESEGHQHVDLTASSWFTGLRKLHIDAAAHEARTGEEESCLLVLSGTHDLYAGGGSWISRGLREDPAAGRPVALFMPPNTPYRIVDGAGEVLVVSTRQPASPIDEQKDKSTLSVKPLLQLAGSGKAFDPASGEWKPQESFPNAPEAILPRRIEREESGGVVREKVFTPDYKALALCVDEVVLSEGSAFEDWGDGASYPEECLVYVRTDGDAELRCGDQTLALRGEGCGLVSRAAGVPVQLRATNGRCYAMIATAGTK